MRAGPSPGNWISATLPKAGHRPEENEDAVAAAPARSRFAVADGATEGWESRAWAAHLAAAYARTAPGPADFARWLAAVRRAWRPREPSGPAAWYVAEKREQGSFATLLGVELRASRAQPGRAAWKAVAVGDSCLLHVRDSAVRAAFPLTGHEQFGDRPALVPSSPAVACPPPEWLAGHADPGDLLLLATDAAASRLLDPAGLEAALAAAGESLRTGDRAPLLDWCRTVQAAVNDDVSVVALRVPGDRESP